MTDRGPKRSIAIVALKLRGLSGKVSLLERNIAHLTKWNWDVHVFTHSVAAERFAGAAVQIHRMIGPSLGRHRRLGRFDGWAGKRTRHGFDVVCGHGELLCQDVLHLHNCLHGAHEAVHGKELAVGQSVTADWQQRLLTEQKFGRVVATSRLMVRDLVRRYGIAEEKITVVRPGFDEARFFPATEEVRRSSRRQLGLAGAGPVVGLITSGDFEKRGVAPFLRALSGLPAGMKQALQVIVVGKEHTLSTYRQLAQASGMADRIHFLPPRADVETFYHALDLCVHPAHFEEFGVSVLEAMACGLPVFMTRTVGASELLPHDVRSQLPAKAEAHELRAGIEALLSDDERRRSWASTCLQAAHGHTWQANARGHSECYERVLEASRSRV